MYTVKQLADLANVSRRTLRYYDQIDLLKPTAVGQNGYRYYDQTILHLEGKIKMDNKDLFAGFDEAKQKAYAEEASRRWDPKLVKQSNQRWNNLSKEQQKAIMQEGNQIYTEMVDQLGADPGSDAVQAIVARWHQHIRHFYEPGYRLAVEPTVFSNSRSS